VLVRAVQPRQRDAQRTGEHQVEQDGEDGGAGRHRPEQRHQQRHAHEAGVGEGGDQRAERASFQRMRAFRLKAMVPATISSAQGR
jgi:hypothetical protein